MTIKPLLNSNSDSGVAAGKGLTVIERAPVAEGAKLRWVVHPKSSSGVLVELI